MIYHNINPALLDLGTIQIRYYGLFYAFGFLIAYFMIPRIAQHKGLKITKDDAADFIFYAIFGVVLGARLGYALFYNFAYYSQNLAEIFAVWKGGLSFHGGFLGALVACVYFCRKKKIKFLDFLDVIVVPVALALALGRVGNFMNGELYGRVTDVSWCLDYSASQYIADIPDGCRHPSQLYSSAKDLALFGILLFMSRKKLPPGFMFWSFVALYGLFRTVVEFFRQPDAQIGFVFGSLSMGQLLSIPMFLVGSVMVFRLLRKNKAP
jgi:phosphatidylglycerol---prolipoprotein diacylglyceryl transferase